VIGLQASIMQESAVPWNWVLLPSRERTITVFPIEADND